MSHQMTPNKNEQKKQSKRGYFIPVYIILIGIFFYSSYRLVEYYYSNYKAEKW